jgi:hypothetical protein
VAARRGLQPGGHGASIVNPPPPPLLTSLRPTLVKRSADWEDNLVGFEASVIPPLRALGYVCGGTGSCRVGAEVTVGCVLARGRVFLGRGCLVIAQCVL